MIRQNEVILFQGDSITDCGRDRQLADANAGPALGGGYVRHATATLLADQPGDRIQVYNRGIGGNRIPDLLARWDDDALALKPTVLSILIGVNDEWRFHDSNGGTSLDEFDQGYRQLLERTRAALPEVRLVLCEPFVLRCGSVTDKWFPSFDRRRETVRKIADDFDATFVAFQAMFDEACQQAAPADWAADGVHPTLAGHARMAQTWLNAVAE